MDKIQETLLQLLASAIHGRNLSPNELSSWEWHLLCLEAKAHDVHPIVVNALKKLKIVIGDANINEYWSNLVKITTLHQIYLIDGISEFFERLESANIQVIVLKGLFFRTLYPIQELRTMGDVDFYVQQKDLKTVSIILNDLGYTLNKNSHSVLHHVFTHPARITIEIHYLITGSSFSQFQQDFNKVIWEERTSKLISSRPWFGPTDVNHAIYCCMHMLNHVQTAGFGLRQLCDLTLLIERNPSFNWEEFIGKVKTYKITNLTYTILAICHGYLHLGIPDKYLAVIQSIEKDKVDYLLNHIFQSGVFGAKNKSLSVNRSLARYRLNEKKKLALGYLFPAQGKLGHAYAYAKKNKYLLPIAWLHRIFVNLIRRDLKLKEKLPDNSIIMQHVELVKWLNSE